MDEKSAFREQMPQTIGRYKVQESIGYGAMGAVYKAFDPLIKRTLAIKTIRLDIPRQSPQYKSFIERFYHEARISGTLSHPNIVTLFDIGEEGGIPYLAMEFVEGETILSIIERGFRFNPEKVIGLISQIAAAVDYAHSKGVIHRDIKPSNLILSDGERVKVTDFGIAKLVDAEMTQSGTLLGTPSYMSPEQAMGDKLDGRSDIFSLGVCAFEMLAGEQPFPGNNVTSILYKLVHVDPIEPANLEMNGLLPQKWHEVFGRVLAKKPDDRYQTATDFVQDLEYCLGAWFGAAMGEDLVEATLARAMPAEKAGTSSGSRSTPAMAPPAPSRVAPPDDVATTVLPVFTEAVPIPVLTPPSPPAAEPVAADDDSMATVHLKAPKAPDESTKPMEIPPPRPGPAEKDRDRNRSDAPEATLMMKAPVAAPVPAPPPPPPPAATPTVMISVDQLPAARLAPAKAPTDAPPDVTVVMSSAELARRVADPTVRGTVPPTEVVSQPTMRQSSSPPARKTAPPHPRPAPAKAAPPPPAPVVAPPSLPVPVPAGEPQGALASIASLPPAVLLGGAAVMFLVAAAIVAMLILKRAPEPSPTPAPVASSSTEAPGPTAAPAAAPGRLYIESQPAGADVIVNGEPRGITPLDLAGLPLGAYEVKMELKGFEPRTQSVSLTAEAPESQVRSSLSRVGPVMGSAEILSDPAGAAVSVDNVKVGVTPLTDYRTKVGSHRVDVSKEGYEPWSGNVVIQAGSKGRVDAQLRPIARPVTPVPTAAPEAPEEERIYVESELDTSVRKVSGPASPQPRLRAGESLSVLLSFVVSETGEALDVKVIESGGKALDDAVVAMVRGSRFTPGNRRGTKVKARLQRKYTFKAG